MGGGASKPSATSNGKKPKKVSADRVAASSKVLELLESNQPDEGVAAQIAARKIDANFKMNLMYHDEDGWNLVHVASSSRCAAFPTSVHGDDLFSQTFLCVSTHRVGDDRAACIKALLAHKCDVNAVASGTSRFSHTHNASPFVCECHKCLHAHIG